MIILKKMDGKVKTKNLMLFLFFLSASLNIHAQSNNPIECANKCKEEFNKRTEDFEKWIKENEGKNDNNQNIYIEMRKRGNAKAYQACSKGCFPGL